MGLETVVFGKKTLSDLLKDIYDNSRKKDKQINALIEELKPHVTDTATALAIVPMIKGYVDTGIKNDEHLIKMAAIVQRSEGSSGESASDFISPEELAKLLDASNEIGKDIDKIKDNDK